MEKLRIEIKRLSSIVDIFESQPDLMFCIDESGNILHVPDTTLAFFRYNPGQSLKHRNDKSNAQNPKNIDQLFSPSNVNVIMSCVQYSSTSNYGDASPVMVGSRGKLS